MRALPLLAALAIAISAPVLAAPASPIVGAWRLVEIAETGSDGKTVHHTDLKGSLIYTADGYLSVQVLYPGTSVNNDYVKEGYEASFGRYTVDVRARRVTHHVEGANVAKLIGAILPRTYRVTGRRLVIGPLSPGEHWSVIWERE